MAKLRIAVLTCGEPGPHELWTLRRLASITRDVRVVQDAPPMDASPLDLARTLAGRRGTLGALEEAVGRALAYWLAARDEVLLEEMFDIEDLRAWWTRSGILPVEIRAGDRAATHAALSWFAPDVIVRLSGNLPGKRILSLARFGALDLRHGHGPLCRGFWSSPRGILQGRPDWIGAEVVTVGGGARRERSLRRVHPQLAPGDTHVDLFFRAHLEATEALAEILDACAKGGLPKPASLSAGELPARAAPTGLRESLRLLSVARGRRAPVLLARGLEC